MASHANLRFMLKTPEGYLTSTGTTQDINDKNIIVMNILEIGGFLSSKETQISNFFKRTSLDPNFCYNQCEVVYYSCPLDVHYSCEECNRIKGCEFWNNREACKIN